MSYAALSEEIKDLQTIVIIQADNPDGDSLASALALEEILTDLGKKPILYCGSLVPTYLRHMSGWDRVVQELPQKFDGSIIVDTSAITLLETLTKSGELQWLKTKPCIILDHHTSAATIDFASLVICEPRVSTGELIFAIATDLSWNLSHAAKEFIAYSILSDSLGLTSEAVNAESIFTLAKLVEGGVSLSLLDTNRRALQKKSPAIVKYKGELLQRIQYAAEGRIATVHIPWPEIQRYSHEYNPSMLAIDEMRMTENVQLAIAFKEYPDGKITGKIRANYGYKVAHMIAEHFGGGGHPYAAGFKITNGKTYNEIYLECTDIASGLLDTLIQENNDETIQHSYS